LLATDKCFETVENKDTGEKMQRRTTYFEICTEDQAPKIACNVHGGGGGGIRDLVVKIVPGEQWPRASLAVDVSAVRPVLMKAPTVLGADPYNSSRSVTNAIAMKAFEGQNAPLDSSTTVPAPKASTGDQIEVRRPMAVRPTELQNSVLETPIKIDPPPPLEF
jgi:penicillin-binding protein 1A